jgi:S1-C subfamily serine protease
MATDRDGFSLGSGTLVAVSEHHGLVVTNWHVIRDAAGLIGVALPNGFRSPATVLKSDSEWDLAALAIWRPNVEPVPVASQPPQPGELLTIAGYGSGQYRTITGRCTQYVAPGFNQPFEMVELSAPARQGDSGGPIFNSRGELAGVLFGTGGGKTSGSYCGRVRTFLASVKDDFFRLRPNPAMVAQAPPSSPAPANTPPPHTAAISAGAPPAGPSAPATPAPAQPGQVAGIPRGSPPAAIRAGDGGWTGPSPAPMARIRAAPPQNAPFLDWPVARSTLWADIKNYLAVVGVAAILFHALRFLAGGTFSQRGRHGW